MNEQIKQFAEKKHWQYLADGWDHVVYTNTDNSTVFRIPKDLSDRNAFALELAALPQLQDIGIVVPQPTLKNDGDFFWAEYPFVKGEKLTDIVGAKRDVAIGQVCRSLQVLHQKPKLGANVPVKDSGERYTSRLAEIDTLLGSLLNAKELAYAKEMLQRVLDLLPEDDVNTLLHGDVSFDHIYTDGEEVSLIDWSDMMYTDPAYEFNHLLRALPEESQTMLHDSYGPGPDNTFWKRANMYVFTDTVDVLSILVQSTKKDSIPFFVERIKSDMIAWAKGRMPQKE